MKRYICLLLALTMLSGLLAGCGAKKKLLGTWECAVDISDTIQSFLAENQVAEDFAVTDFTVTAQLMFLKDGDFWLLPDKEQLAAQIEALLVKLEDSLVDTLQAQLGAQQVEVPIEELLTMSGFDKDLLTQQLRQQFPVQALTEHLTKYITLAGRYQVKGDKLLLSTDAEEKLKDHYFVYTVNENTLTFTEMVGTAPVFVADNILLKALPLSFTKLS